MAIRSGFWYPHTIHSIRKPSSIIACNKNQFLYTATASNKNQKLAHDHISYL
jgi:hypothetical protein